MATSQQCYPNLSHHKAEFTFFYPLANSSTWNCGRQSVLDSEKSAVSCTKHCPHWAAALCYSAAIQEAWFTVSVQLTSKQAPGAMLTTLSFMTGFQKAAPNSSCIPLHRSKGSTCSK